MVNVGHKKETHRSATAVAHVVFSKSITYQTLTDASLEKGDALAVARIAGIQAAKKTADIIPLTHPGLGITGVEIDICVFAGTKARDESAPSTSEVTSNNSSNRESTSLDALRFGPREMNSEHGGVRLVATVTCWGKTGVEMEALTAVNAAALTMYDMLKAVDKAMVITGSRVIEKKGGKSGSWRWNEAKQRIERFEGNTSTDSEVQIRKVARSETKTSYETSNLTQSSVKKADVPENSDIEKGGNYRRNDLAPTSTFTPDTGSKSSTTVINSDPGESLRLERYHSQPDEDSPQAVIEAEWAALSKSFTQPQASSDAGATAAERNNESRVNANFAPFAGSAYSSERDESERLDEARIHKVDISGRRMYSGHADTRCDAEGFRKMRQIRYEEWKKSR